MNILIWFLMVFLGAALGVLFVQYLSVHPLRMNAYLAAALSTFYLLILLIATQFRGWEIPLAALLTLGFYLVGHLGMTRLILKRGDPRPVPILTREPGDRGLGHSAVIYFTHGEPQTYNPIGWINQFNEFDEQGIPFVPLIARPFFFHALRKKYLQVGASGHRGMHQQMLCSLETAYRAEGDTSTRFYLSFLDDNPRPDAAAIMALNEGASKIIVCEVFLTISNHTAEGEELIKELEIEETFGIPVEYTGPLYDSRILKEMFLERANANLEETPKSKVGVLLVGHGQPDEWDVEWSTETEQEISFRKEILNLFEQDGYQPENLGIAWMEFKDPKPAVVIDKFLANGIERLLYFSAAISADAIHSQYDVPDLVAEAGFPEGFQTVNLGAWNNDPLTVLAVKEKIDPLLHL